MATPEERMKILKMIQEGKISAEDAIQLLEALESAVSRPAPSGQVPALPYPALPAGPAALGARSPRWFRVLVTDVKTGKTRVNVRLPVSMVSAGIKLGARFAPQVEGIDTTRLMEHLNSGEVGKIIDVFDDEDGEHVEVFIE